MKELDKTKKYDLSKLTDEQFKTLLTSVGYGENLEYINRNCLYYKENYKEWVSSVSDLKTNACATELFEDEYKYRKQEEERQIMLNKINNKEKCMTLREYINKDFEELSLFKEKINKTMTEYNIEFNNGSSIKLYNKTMTEEEKELWLFVYKESVKYQQSFLSHKAKADQAVKDFRDALKM